MGDVPLPCLTTGGYAEICRRLSLNHDFLGGGGSTFWGGQGHILLGISLAEVGFSWFWQ